MTAIIIILLAVFGMGDASQHHPLSTDTSIAAQQYGSPRDRSRDDTNISSSEASATSSHVPLIVLLELGLFGTVFGPIIGVSDRSGRRVKLGAAIAGVGLGSFIGAILMVLAVPAPSALPNAHHPNAAAPADPNAQGASALPKPPVE